MARRPPDLLEEGERLLWRRIPRSGAYRKLGIAVLVLGHVAFVVLGIWLARSMGAARMARIILAIVFCLVLNVPLLIWELRRSLPRRGGARVVYFLTDGRVGLLMRSGELMQMPLVEGLSVKVAPGSIEFRLPEQIPICFAGLSEQEVRLVEALVRRLLSRGRQLGSRKP